MVGLHHRRLTDEYVVHPNPACTVGSLNTAMYLQQLTKKRNGNHPRAKYRRRQPKLWLRTTGPAPLLSILSHEPAIHVPPDGIGGDARQHANKEPEECKTRL